MPRFMPSTLWNHFIKKESTRGECKYCKKMISFARGSTGNLKRHLRNRHPMVSLERISQPRDSSQSMRTADSKNLALEEISQTLLSIPSPTTTMPHRCLPSFSTMQPGGDSEDNYAKTVADRLRELPKKKRIIIKKKIDDILFEACMKEEDI